MRGALLSISCALCLLLAALLIPAHAAAKGSNPAAAAKAFATQHVASLSATDCPEGVAILHTGGGMAQVHALHRMLAVRWQHAHHMSSESAAAAFADLRVCALVALRHTLSLRSTSGKAVSLAQATSWSFLATALMSAHPQSSDVSLCFAEARRLAGAVSPYVASWDMLGPFVHGKTELDGDPLEGLYPRGHGSSNSSSLSVGAEQSGIEIAELDRGNRTLTYPSEFADGGVVRWRELVTPLSPHNGAAEPVTISFPNVRWNDIAQSISHAALETQAWLVGVIHAHKSGRFSAHCRGITHFSIDGHMHVGDQYSKGMVMGAMDLARGPHVVRIRARSKVQGQFNCRFAQVSPAKSLRLSAPALLPDLVDQRLFSSYLPVGVLNLSPEWLRSPTFSTPAGSAIEVAPLQQQDDTTRALHAMPSIAPGQITYLPVRLQLKDNAAQLARCPPAFKLTLTATYIDAKGAQAHLTDDIMVQLRCRKSFGESFIMTFLDVDGSVSHAGVIPPAAPCRVPAGSLASSCPLVVASHGTGVTAGSQADSFKYMKAGEKDYTFGIEGAWVLAPSRFGAHNHEGVGASTIDTAIQALADLTAASTSLYADRRADPARIVSTGHSMGGHGSWLWSVRHPDRLLCAAPAAGWIDKQRYGDSNRPFEEDQQSSHTDAAMRGLLLAAVDEDNVDMLASHLAGIPTLVRVGADDRTTHPWYSRRMVRVLREWNARSFPNGSGAQHVNSLVTLSEVSGKEHWWWDTDKSNDGGALHDPAMRRFWKKCLLTTNTPPPMPPMWTVHTFHAGAAGSRGGISISKLVRSSQLASIHVRRDDSAGVWHLSTRNVAGFTLSHVPHILTSALLPRGGFIVDGQSETPIQLQELELILEQDRRKQEEGGRRHSALTDSHICYTAARWQVCRNGVTQRDAQSSGPMRQVYERPFLFVVGSGSSSTGAGVHASTGTASSVAGEHLRMGVLMAGLHAMAAETHVRIVRDTDILAALTRAQTQDPTESTRALLRTQFNMILLGGPATNAYAAIAAKVASELALPQPMRASIGEAASEYRVAGSPCGYAHATGVGALFLAPLPHMQRIAESAGRQVQCDGAAGAAATCSSSVPHSASLPSSLSVVFDGVDAAARRSLLRLCEPPIPPMVRAPLTNLMPDYVVVGPDMRWKGWGGMLAAGYFNHAWAHQPRRAYDTCSDVDTE